MPEGTITCDIGCDHGFVPIFLVENQICPGVIAMDINKGPLLRAREHIGNVGFSAYIETRLSDGLEKLKPGEADCMIAAGMGGRLICRIMADYPEKLRSLRYLVLQPQSEAAFVRRFVRESGFVIRKEDMVLEDGKFYQMMLAVSGGLADADAGTMKNSGAASRVPVRERRRNDRQGCGAEMSAGQQRYAESLEDEFGPCLLREGHPVLVQYLNWWEKQQNKILNQVLIYPKRRAQVEEELARIRNAREMMGV